MKDKIITSINLIIGKGTLDATSVVELNNIVSLLYIDLITPEIARDMCIELLSPNKEVI